MQLKRLPPRQKLDSAFYVFVVDVTKYVSFASVQKYSGTKKKKVQKKSEQAPGSRVHPCDESTKIDCGFLGPGLCIKTNRACKINT